MRAIKSCSVAIALWFALGSLVAAADSQPGTETGELHVVGIYEGVTKTGNEIHGGRAKVTVDRPGAKVTLVLTAYDRVTWEVVLTPKTQLEKVILGGYYPQALKGAPETTEVVKSFRSDSGGSSPPLGYCYKIDSENFPKVVYQISKLSKLPISSFQGAYRYQHESPFIVDRVQDDERLSADYPKPTPAADLPDLVFQAIHYSGGEGFPGRIEASYGDFTLAGPQLDTLKPLPAGVTRMAFDPKGKRYFGIAGHDVVQWKVDEKTVAKMDLGFDVPTLHWPADVAFDTNRSRLIVASSSCLYAYDTEADKWSALAERPQLTALSYHPKHDCIYGIAMEHSENGEKPILRRYNSEGALLESTPLGPPIIPGVFGRGPGPNGVRMTSADEFVVVLVTPSRHHSEEGGPRLSCIYLVDPKKETTWLTSKEVLPDAKR